MHIRSIVGYLMLMSVLLCIKDDIAAEVSIVPKPKMISVEEGSFNIDRDLGIKMFVADTTHMTLVMQQLGEEIARKNSGELIFDREMGGMIRLGIPAEDNDFMTICEREGLADKRLGKQGYGLLIGSESVTICANTKTGLFYGIQSLKQIIRGAEESGEIPCVKIIDWPDLRYRGVQDDISRGPVPTMAFMKSQVRRLSELKINMLSYYVEHIVKTKSHGDFAPAGAGISIETWKALSDYARQYHMEVIGNFQSLGHFEKILSYPQYAPLGETKNMLSPIRPESFQLLADVYAEMAPAFSSQLFNVNCDETWDLGRGESKAEVEKLGVGRVYANHILRIYKELQKYKKRTMIWGDIILSNPEILEMLPNDIMMGAWTYGADDKFSDFFAPFRKSGFDFMYSCGVLNSNRLVPDYRMTIANIKNFTHAAYPAGTAGMLCTVWDDGGNAFFPLDWYGVAYAADQSWHVNDDPVRDYNRRFDRAVYGNLNGTIAETFQTMIPITDLAETYEMNDLVLWKQVIPQREKQIKLGVSDWMTVSEITRQADSLLSTARPACYNEDLDYIRLIIDEYSYMAECRFNLLEAAKLYRDACLIEKESREKATALARQSGDLLTGCRIRLEELKALYARLWLLESKTYWLDHLMESFDEKINDYDDAEKLLEKTVSELIAGEFLAPPNEIRLDIQEQEGQYFQYWLLCGPFPNEGGEGRETDFLEGMGGEAAASPTPGFSFNAGIFGNIYWQKYASPLFSQVDLSSVYEKNERAVAYAFCRIYCPCREDVKATIGSNDGIQVFINGRRIFKKYIKRSLIPDEDIVILPLKEGRNDLLLKIDQNKGGWGFSFRLPDEKVRNHKYKYYIVD